MRSPAGLQNAWRRPGAAFTAPVGVAASVLSLRLIAWLLTNVDYAKEGLAVIVAAGVGLIVNLLVRMFGRPAIV